MRGQLSVLIAQPIRIASAKDAVISHRKVGQGFILFTTSADAQSTKFKSGSTAFAMILEPVSFQWLPLLVNVRPFLPLPSVAARRLPWMANPASENAIARYIGSFYTRQATFITRLLKPRRIPVHPMQALAGADPEALSKVEISPSGLPCIGRL